MSTQILNQGTQVLSNASTESGGNFTGGLLQKGEFISGWIVDSKINVLSGEADLYIAAKDGTKSVIKHYRSTVKPKTAILESLKGLNHPDIVNVYEYGNYKDRFYEIMEYAEGGSLDSKNPDGTYLYLPLSEEQAVQICKEVINSYKTFHEKGIFHRDIKPANLYYRARIETSLGKFEGQDIVIGDFGISSIKGEDERTNTHKTQTASRTTGYAAPEVLSGIISSKMDYYALGITLWELLTGKDPFVLENGKRRNDAHLIRDTIEGRIADDLLSKEPQLSQSMQRLIRGLLVIAADKRWGYEEVTRHLAGEQVDVFQKQKKAWNFTIGETSCSTLESLGAAIIDNPDAAQKYVFRGLLGGFLEDDYSDIAAKITEIVDSSSSAKDYYNSLMKIAYILNPSLPFKAGNGFSVSNIDEVLFLLENAPETMLPLLKTSGAKLYTYLEIIGFGEQAKSIWELWKDIPALDYISEKNAQLISKTIVVLKGYTIKPFKLARYADFELSTLEQMLHIPKDMQSHILNLVAEKSYEGNFLPWLDMMTPDCRIEDMKTGTWQEFLESIKV
ncbi:serine/threonine protein kinase [Treponema primitia]|uniref:serine/threonine-protein kinase n=1 Tax=Treponema primitia TaxID=88058 RepID=UPI003981312E